MDLPEKIQDLPPNWARFCLEVERFVSKDLKVDIKNKSLLLAVSGGPDSVALLITFKVLAPRINSSVFVAHLNHGIRKEAKEEAEFVKDLCNKLKVPFFGGRTNAVLFSNRKKIGLEEGARILRYRFLYGVLKKKGTDFILLAHHLNDLAEDILLRIIRGTFWPNMGGMTGFDEKRKILRPFLLTPKKVLKDFLKDLNIPWIEDPSNWDLRYKRNRIRHKILPLLEKENPNFLNVIKRIWILSQLDLNHWKTEIGKLKSREVIDKGCIKIKKSDLKNLSEALRLRWYIDILKRISKGEIITENLLDLDRAVKENRSDKTFQFPSNRVAYLEKEYLIFYKKE